MMCRPGQGNKSAWPNIIAIFGQAFAFWAPETQLIPPVPPESCMMTRESFCEHNDDSISQCPPQGRLETRLPLHLLLACGLIAYLVTCAAQSANYRTKTFQPTTKRGFGKYSRPPRTLQARRGSHDFVSAPRHPWASILGDIGNAGGRRDAVCKSKRDIPQPAKVLARLQCLFQPCEDTPLHSASEPPDLSLSNVVPGPHSVVGTCQEPVALYSSFQSGLKIVARYVDHGGDFCMATRW